MTEFMVVVPFFKLVQLIHLGHGQKGSMRSTHGMWINWSNLKNGTTTMNSVIMYIAVTWRVIWNGCQPLGF